MSHLVARHDREEDSVVNEELSQDRSARRLE